MFGELKISTIALVCKVYDHVSCKIYSIVQRAVALTVLTNQRFNLNSSSKQLLKDKRVEILSQNTDAPLLTSGGIEGVIEVKVDSTDGLLLSGIILPYQDALAHIDGKPKISGRILVAYSGIGGCFEKWYFDGLKELRDNFNASVLMVNYRGVGQSQGVVQAPSDLIDDGYHIAKYALKELAIDPALVHLYGTSMGGGVAVHVAKRLEEEQIKPASVCIDRSYSSLVDTVYEAIPFPFIKSVVRKLMNFASWQIDSASCALKLSSAKLIVIRAKADRVIPQITSLATELEERIVGKAPFKVIDLPGIEKTELELMDEPEFPYWVKHELNQSYRGQLKLLSLNIQSCFEKLRIGINAHMHPFSKNYFPLQASIYEKLLIDTEKKMKTD